MVDIFKLFGVEYREDKYTNCLLKMIECGDEDFKEEVGIQFGFNDGEFKWDRRSFNDIKSNSRKKITPDFVLYNKDRVAIIESKMFAGEGYKQTLDYGNNKNAIKNALGVPNADVALYFLTLSGVRPENQEFTPIKWDEFFERILSNAKFEDICLEVVRHNILEQVKQYKEFDNALYERAYHEMFNSDQYWISPFSILSTGKYDRIWQQSSGKELFNIYNYRITGNGHSEFVTDLFKDKWQKEGTEQYNNIRLFIRIGWLQKHPTVWLEWFYYNKDNINDYVKKDTNITKEMRDSLAQSLKDYKNTWEKQNIRTEYLGPTRRTENSLTALKYELKDSEKTFYELFEDIKEVIVYFSEEIDRIITSLSIQGKYLTFDKEAYIDAVKHSYLKNEYDHRMTFLRNNF